MTIAHTPTPWIQDGLEVWARGTVRFNLVSSGSPRICVVDNHNSESGFEKSNAAHIVKCVNQYDDLVEALKQAYAVCKAHGYLDHEIEEALNKAGAL